MAKFLVTGGAGFIGSHTCLVLLELGHDIVVIDNYSNSSPIALKRVREIAGISACSNRLRIHEGDLLDSHFLDNLFNYEKIFAPFDAVIHFAGLKSVSESVKNPLEYWRVNVSGTSSLLEIMEKYGCHTLLFSSSSTVYGEPSEFPLTEESPVAPIHPYAETKLAVERILLSLNNANKKWKFAALRYFNPVGAHPSGQIGEDPFGIPNNLFPFITQVACGKIEFLEIFGNDFNTPDGTGIRDYIHVMDLAEAHANAVDFLLQSRGSSFIKLNLGTGAGSSVFDVIKAFEDSVGIRIPFKIVNRRPGDVPRLEACSDRAKTMIGWKAKRTLADMCQDGWAWQSANPRGYRGED